ncbi:ROK family protein [Alkaliphilus crotonatoxidans]
MKEKHLIGVDFGGTNIRIGLFDQENRLLFQEKLSTEADKGPDYIINNLKTQINNLMARYSIGGIGIGMPGPLNPHEGVVLGPVNLPGWDEIPLAQIITQSFGIPCYIENDCNVAALAESMEGAGKGLPIVFYITVSTGVGGGLCINGEIISGAYGNAGEIGNIIVSDQPVKHSYLNSGSLEGMVSGTCMLKQARERGLALEQAHEIFLLAQENHPIAREIVESGLDSLAKGMAAIAHVIEPHIFVLGGGVAKAVPDFPDQMKVRFEQYIYPIMRGKIQVALAQLTEPGMVGAMHLVKKKLI